MVSNSLIKLLNFKTIADYQEYIIDSIVNGQRQQATKLIQKLSKSQKKDFIAALPDIPHDPTAKEEAKSIAIRNI